MGGSWGVLGRPGWPRGPSWAPRGDPENMGARSGGSRGGSRSVEIRPESVFLRSLGAKYTYFQGFYHANCVDLSWPVEAPWRPRERFGSPRGLQSWVLGASGGSWKKGPALRGLKGRHRNRKTAFSRSVHFTLCAQNHGRNRCFSDLQKKRVFLKIRFC